MRPIFHPSLVNGRYGDPTVYVETLFKTHSVLFDLGEIASLSPRKIRRVDQIFVSHAHIDHFIGFDHLLRLLVGFEKTVHLYVSNPSWRDIEWIQQTLDGECQQFGTRVILDSERQLVVIGPRART
jgi:ribonuclease BN (tRNA processing enzyme)